MPQNRSDQAGLALALKNHEARIRALEANPIVGTDGGGGDYVFLEEQLAAADGDPLAFTSIPQTYRTLVIEVSVVTVSSGSFDSIQLNGPSNYSQEIYTYGDVGGVFQAYAADMEYVVPGRGLVGDGYYATGRIEFPYYSDTDRITVANWQMWNPQEAASSEPFTGVGSIGLPMGPLTTLALLPYNGTSNGSQHGSDGVVVNGSADFNAPSANFLPNLVGATIGVDGFDYTIAAVISTTEITLSAPWGGSGSSSEAWRVYAGSWAAGSKASLYGIS